MLPGQKAEIDRAIFEKVKRWRIFLGEDVVDSLVRMTADLDYDRSTKLHRTDLIETLRGALKEIVILRERVATKEQPDPFGGPMS